MAISLGKGRKIARKKPEIGLKRVCQMELNLEGLSNFQKRVLLFKKKGGLPF